MNQYTPRSLSPVAVHGEYHSSTDRILNSINEMAHHCTGRACKQCLQSPSDDPLLRSSPPKLCRYKSIGNITTALTNNGSRRLSSGSACETCRRRKTKCDGGQPCAFCAANRIECVHRAPRRKRSPVTSVSAAANKMFGNHAADMPDPSLIHRGTLMKQVSCPSLVTGQRSRLNPPMTPYPTHLFHTDPAPSASVFDHVDQQFNPSPPTSSTSLPNLARREDLFTRDRMPSMMGM
ncbi:hypothetical protein DFQ28_002603 [Apophysomyces sp. BC1034]|nr:hypothetical protein DFQ30_002996 [Apophysomyces sp. BC1015]KAG0179614.1 hypothetical protein DFQ29_001871 [Apophysomyces sp. BC1021]KAG0190028.1 hypothetical protein DFQ28_002603 [Apophysomyces sp. BC1034]